MTEIYHFHSTLQELRSTDLLKISPDVFLEKSEVLFKIFAHNALSFEPKKILYRASKLGESESIPLTKKRLTYPDPKEIKIALGRSNFEGKAVFYASGSGKATLFELNLQPNDRVVLSTWVLKENIWCFPLGYNHESLTRLQANRQCPSNLRSQLSIEEGQEELQQGIYNFFADIFSRNDEKYYPYTAGISSFFLKAMEKCGVIYPSIKTCGNYENIALTTSSANTLELNHVDFFKVEGLDYQGNSKLFPLNYADDFSQDKILWSNSLRKDDKYYEKLLY